MDRLSSDDGGHLEGLMTLFALSYLIIMGLVVVSGTPPPRRYP